MCATSLGWRHLVNSYGAKAGWLIPFVDKSVGGWQVKLCDAKVSVGHIGRGLRVSSELCIVTVCFDLASTLQYANKLAYLHATAAVKGADRAGGEGSMQCDNRRVRLVGWSSTALSTQFRA